MQVNIASLFYWNGVIQLFHPSKGWKRSLYYWFDERKLFTRDLYGWNTFYFLDCYSQSGMLPITRN